MGTDVIGKCIITLMAIKPFNRRCRIYSGFHFLLAH